MGTDGHRWYTCTHEDCSLGSGHGGPHRSASEERALRLKAQGHTPDAASARERDLATVRRALEFYADKSSWREDDWNVTAIIDEEYGDAGKRARRALPALRRLSNG